MDKFAERIYNPNTQDLAIFKKTHEKWGEFSNMASGFPIIVNDTLVRSSEALYQAMKFTHRPDIQEKILSEKSPMTAKMIGKPYRDYIRSDFEEIKVRLMKWSVRAKLLANYEKFSLSLLSSNQKYIVEESRRDSFWGAKRTDEGLLIGVNVLGRILMELRAELKEGKDFQVLGHLEIPNFNFLGRPVEPIYKSKFIQEVVDPTPQGDFFE
jgi:ribA/ribD-fused uncharacterized protein